MTEIDYDLLKRKREISKPYMHVTSNDLGRFLQAEVAKENSEWTFHEGKLFINEWGTRCDIPLTKEHFTRCKTPDGKWDHQHDLLCTFSNFIHTELVADPEEGDVLKITVDEGESLSGRYLGVRCIFYVKGPWWKIKDFQKQIEQRWITYTQTCVDVEELARMERRRREISESLLAGTYEVNKDDDDE